MSRRDDLLAAGRGLLAEVDVGDLTGFLGPRPLAARAGTAAATVTHHFPPADVDSPAARAVLLSALDALSAEQGGRFGLEPRPDGYIGDPTTDVRRLLTDGIRRMSPGDPGAHPAAAAAQVAGLLLAAAAPHDPDACEVLARLHATRSREGRDLVEVALVRLSRRWVPGIGAASFTATLLALVQGFTLHHRFDPDGSPPELFADMALRLLAACTEPSDRDAGPSLGTHDGLTPRQRTRVEEVVRGLYAIGGWSHVDLREVCRRAGVGRQAFLETYGSVDGLAVVLWQDRVPPLRVVADRDRSRGVDDRVWGLMVAFATSAFADRSLTIALLRRINEYAAVHGAADDDDLDDPRNAVPLDLLLSEAIADHPAALWPDVTESPAMLRESAGLLMLTLALLTVRRPGWGPVEVADRVFRTTWAGMRVVRPVRPPVHPSG